MRIVSAVVLLLAVASRADDITPWTNLVGLKAVSPSIHVALNLRGAEELAIQPAQIQQIVASRLAEAKLLGPKSTDLPSVEVIVSGEGTGGGGADYSVEVLVIATVASPFVPSRNIRAVIWRATQADKQVMSYDTKQKKIVHPPGSPKERIHTTVEEVITQFANSVRKANARAAG